MRFKPLYPLIALLFGAYGLLAQADRADSLKKAGNYGEALSIFKAILEDDLNRGNVKKLSEDYNSIANVYAYMGDYQKSTEHYFKALKLAEEKKDNKAVAFINYNIGRNYATMHQDSVGANYINAAIKTLVQENQPDSILGDCYMALGIIYGERQDYKNALDHFKLAEELFKKNEHKAQLANVYVNLSYLELGSANYGVANDYARKALSIFREVNDRLGIAVSYINLQMMHYNANENPKTPTYKKELQTCIALLDSANDAIKDIKSPEHFMTIYQNKSELYDYLGNKDSAHLYLQKHVALKDSIYDINQQKQIQELRIQYESDRKEKDNEVLAAQNKSKSYFIIILITGAALVVTVLLLILVRNNSRKKQKEIEFERNKLELEQKTLRAQMNPHFMFNAINSIQRYILKKNEQEAYDYLAKFSKLMRIVLNNSQEKVLMLSQELEMIQLYVEMEQLRFEDGFHFAVKIGKEVNENETKVPAMLIQPYIENAIWHGLMNLKDERQGVLKLEINLIGDELRIVIEDNGIGREKAKTYNTDEKHKSAGMKLTEQRLVMINKMQEYGSAKVAVTDLYDGNKKGVGTRVEISLPVDGK